MGTLLALWRAFLADLNDAERVGLTRRVWRQYPPTGSMPGGASFYAGDFLM